MAIYVISHKNEFKIPSKNFRKGLVLNKHDIHLDSFYYETNGENIVDLQPYYCELTGLYWIWKNMDDNIVGLEHYRRFFLKDKKGFFSFNFLQEKEIINILKTKDIILPERRVVETNIWDDYSSGENLSGNHVANDLIVLEKIIKENAPDYYDDFIDTFKNKKYQYLCNMFICKKSIIDEYCSWAFPIYNLVYNEINCKDRQGNAKRAIGYLAERLFNVWIYHKNLKIEEKPILVIAEPLYKIRLKKFIKKILFYDRWKRR